MASASGTQVDEPFEQWRVATATLAAAEARDPYSVEIEHLANAVIAARVALTQARIAVGWTPEEDELGRLAKDEKLVKQGLGAVEKFLPT